MAHLKRLEAARHRRQRKILGTVWKDRFTTEAVCNKMGSNTMQSTFKEQRLRWFVWGTQNTQAGHVLDS